MVVSRRTFGAGLATAGALLGSGQAPSLAMGSTGAANALDLESDVGKFNVFARMAASLANENVFWWRSMVRYGIVDQEVTPLHRTLGGLVMGAKNNGDGTITTTSREVGYHLDVETGEPLVSWTNPISGA